MRYPHTYSLLVVLSIFAAFALSACERVSLRPYPEERALPDIPSTIIDILPEEEKLQAPERVQENNAEQTIEDQAGNGSEESHDVAKNTNNEGALSKKPIENEKTQETQPETPIEALIGPVYFALDDYTVSFDDKMRLNELAKQLNLPKNRHLKLRIEGHCDDRGTRDYNFALGERRAAAVAQFLSAQGVKDTRIHTISYGKERPVALGTSEAIRAQNRRAQLIIMLGVKN